VAWKDRLQIFGPKHELLQTVSLDRAQELLDGGHVIPVGPRKRIRALIATRGSEEFLRANRPPRARPDTHKHETAENPAGVWTFRKQHWAYHEL